MAKIWSPYLTVAADSGFMREILLIVFAVLAFHCATSPETAAWTIQGLRSDIAISGDLIGCTPPHSDPGPSLRRDVDQVLEREKNEKDPKDSIALAIAEARFFEVFRLPPARPFAMHESSAALLSARLATSLRC
ncbi:hypothetical protein [Planctomyces sp. SH-PL62]|uniref:hypothetical protein n=1 Tax=Planctomyces sp. SH-PL62 TaxID=1636152 RepID=UPI0008386158|nr:hypothetical protein [Planctomyces sp. SH-PL62]